MDELKLFQICVFGPCATGKSRLIHNLLCEPYMQYEITKQTSSEFRHYTLKIESSPGKYLDNLNIRFVDAIGFQKDMDTDKRHETKIFGEMEKTNAIIQGEINISDLLLICLDLSKIKINNNDLNNNNIDKENIISEFFNEYTCLHGTKKPVIIILTFFDQFLKNYSDNEDLRDNIEKKLKNLIKTLCEKNNINFIKTYIYNIEKKFFDGQYGCSDISILQKILKACNIILSDQYVKEYKKLLIKRYETETKMINFLTNWTNFKNSVDVEIDNSKNISTIDDIENKLNNFMHELITLKFGKGISIMINEKSEDIRSKLNKKKSMINKIISRIKKLENEIDSFIIAINKKNITTTCYYTKKKEFSEQIEILDMTIEDKKRINDKLILADKLFEKSCILI